LDGWGSVVGKNRVKSAFHWGREVARALVDFRS
jgi:hypothetical protein